MPELPEVETVRRQLEPLIVGAGITDAGSHRSARFRQASGAVDHQVCGVSRRGKYLLVGLAGSSSGGGDAIHPVPTGPGTDPSGEPTRELIVHLGMTGGLSVPPRLPDDSHVRAWWSLDTGGFLVFRDVRRLGRVAVVEAGDHAGLPTLHHLGPEPFDPALDGRRFHALLAASRRRVKTSLLSQRPIAGVGNIYADESLWRARINPSARRVGPGRAADLLAAIRDVLTEALDNGGTTLRDYRTPDGAAGRNRPRLTCYGRSGQPCTACGTMLVSKQLDQRTTTWCPSCQAR